VKSQSPATKSGGSVIAHIAATRDPYARGVNWPKIADKSSRLRRAIARVQGNRLYFLMHTA